jgi:hypothetical protein
MLPRVDKSHRIKYQASRHEIYVRGFCHITLGMLFGAMLMWLIDHAGF